MKKAYHIIEKNERLTMSANPSDMRVYKTDNKTSSLSCLTMTNKSEAIKIAKMCGMDVVTYIGSETQNDERVFVS